MAKKNNTAKETVTKSESIIERAAAIKKDNPSLKYYEAIEKAKSEIYEME